MAEEEHFYTISMKAAKNIPANKRTPWAIKHIQSFIMRHIPEAEVVWIDPKLNEKLWSTDLKKIPSKIRVKVIHFEDNLVEVSPFDSEDEEDQ